MFVDRVRIRVRAGKGGDGAVSFRRRKYIPKGGPDGGNGGKGGDVIIRVDEKMKTLIDLRYKDTYVAENGKPGGGDKKTGRSGSDVIVRVPPGSVVEDLQSGDTLADFEGDEGSLVAAGGGRGGRGNFTFRSSTNQAPRQFTRGKKGEQRELRITLKLIADVGLVGLPNSGKSTLLASLSRAHPAIASYPFSTVYPVLGIVSVDVAASYCMVDIPGLIEGAHRGRGLGLEFLRHVERCRVLLFVIDSAGQTEPADAYRQLTEELSRYSPGLLERPCCIALNKMDLKESRERGIEPGETHCRRIFRISALTGEGVREMSGKLYQMIREQG